MRGGDVVWLLGIPAALVGCRGPTDATAWRRARAACGLDEGDHPSTTLRDGRLPTTLSEGCATWLAEDLGVDWESFGGSPGPVTGGGDPLSLTLMGAWALVAADYGTVGALLADPDGAAWGQEALAELATRGGFRDPDAAGALLYAHVLDHVDRVAYDPGLEGVGARFQGGTVYIPTTGDPWDAPPAWMASVLVHEASHHHGPAHVRCSGGVDPDCDEDLHGIYGTQAQAIAAAVARLDPADPLTPIACAQSQIYIDAICRMVNHASAPGPCDPGALRASCPAP
ncbi:hypothetical protein L6R53_17480 [Myxococcota bacterium]|nr:hypothetical protein [Myxococcota bacterium]